MLSRLGILDVALSFDYCSDTRSKSSLPFVHCFVWRKEEKTIADYLTCHSIAYYYEAEAASDWFIFKSKISRPDFFLPQFNLFIEYWGLVDSPDPRTRSNYVRSIRWKMAQYRKNNIRLVSIYPSYLNSLDHWFRRKLREVRGVMSPRTLGS